MVGESPEWEHGGRRPMGEDAFASAGPPPSAFQKPAASSLRLVGLLKQPAPDPDPSAPHHHLELDESDVIWSPASDGLSSSPPPLPPPPAAADEVHNSVDRFSSPSPDLVRSQFSALFFSPSVHTPRPFTSERCGLSAALEEDLLPLVRQSCPAAAAARATRPVAVPVGRPDEASVRMGHHQSAPVNGPAWPKWRKGRKAVVLDGLEEEEGLEDAKEDEEEEEEEEEEEMVPPHVIVARSHVMTFSVFEGVGRTLKGRDLRRVRNAVLQKTGFLDM